MATEARYVPAAGRAAFTRLYDPVMAATMREQRFRGELVNRVVRPASRDGTIVDVGCGTGTLVALFASEAPDLRSLACGLDRSAPSAFA